MRVSGPCSATVVFALMLAVCSATPVLGAVWHVNPGGTGDAPTIQAAFDAASPGDVIELAPGTYIDSHTRTIQGHSVPQTTTSVAFFSPGVSITSSGGPAVTIIDGQNDRHGLFAVDAGAVSVSGITFHQCARAGGEIWGGGLMFHRSEPLVENCVFRACDGHAGAGVMVSQGANAIIRFNTFVNNTSTDLGGALEIFAHPSVAVVENNTFVGNVADRHGGAVLINSSTAQLSNNIYAWNTVGTSGGAVACLNSAVVSGECGLYWGNAAPEGSNIDACGVAIGENHNIVADPLFCDPVTGDYTISSGSPARPGDPSGCGLRGALPVACGPVSVYSVSWGRLKSGYRQ